MLGVRKWPDCRCLFVILLMMFACCICILNLIHCYVALCLAHHTACNCDRNGSVNGLCDVTGRCVCRPNAVGLKCDACEENFLLGVGGCASKLRVFHFVNQAFSLNITSFFVFVFKYLSTCLSVSLSVFLSLFPHACVSDLWQASTHVHDAEFEKTMHPPCRVNILLV